MYGAVDASLAGQLDLSLLRDAPPAEGAASSTAGADEDTGALVPDDSEETPTQIADALEQCFLAESNPSNEELDEGSVQQFPSASMLDAEL